jgi:hypothetical protein
MITILNACRPALVSSGRALAPLLRQAARRAVVDVAEVAIVYGTVATVLVAGAGSVYLGRRVRRAYKTAQAGSERAAGHAIARFAAKRRSQAPTTTIDGEAEKVAPAPEPNADAEMAPA